MRTLPQRRSIGPPYAPFQGPTVQVGAGRLALGLRWASVLVLAVAATAGRATAQVGDDVPIHSDAPVPHDAPVRLHGRTLYPPAGFRLDLPEASLAQLSAHEPDSAGVHGLVRTMTWPVTDALRAELETAGVVLHRYVPDRAWIATLSRSAILSETPEGRAARALLRFAEPLPLDEKLSSRLREGRAGAWSREPDGRWRVRIRFHDDVDPVRFLEGAAARWPGFELVETWMLGSGCDARVPPSLLLELAAEDRVLYVDEALPPAHGENDQSRVVIGAETLQTGPWNLTGAGVRLGVSDVGVADASHPDFGARVQNVEMVAVDAHTTHVVGTLAGSGIQSPFFGGSAGQWRGVAPGADVFVWERGGYVSDLMSGIPAYTLDAVNNSWGFTVDESNCDLFGNYEFLSAQIDALVRGAAGRKVSVVFSAGNERDHGDCPLLEGAFACINPPKAAKNALVVGAIHSDTQEMTNFSSWGPVDDGRLKPDLVASGCEAAGEGYVRSTLPGGGYGGPGFCGTSMAAPAVTGAIALLLEAARREIPSFDLEPSMAKALLAATAVDLGTPGPDFAFGHGSVDVDAAHRAWIEATPQIIVLPTGNEESGAVWEQDFVVPVDAPDLRWTLAWDDPEAAPVSAVTLVNDLDIVLVSALGDTVRPWVLDAAFPSLPAVRGRDARNNLESITVSDPVPGLWRVRVTGEVPMGPQIASVAGLDARGPLPVTEMNAVPWGVDSVAVGWDRSDSYDTAGSLLVRRDAESAWPGPTAGQAYTVGSLLPGVEVRYVGDDDFSPAAAPFFDDGVEPGVTLVYEVWAFDGFLNYADATVDSVTIDAPASAPAGNSELPEGFLLAMSRNPSPAPVVMVLDVPAPAVADLAGSATDRVGSGGAFDVEIRVMDVTGRRVKVWTIGDLRPGRHALAWDGSMRGGQRAPAGLYWIEAVGAAGTVRAKVSLLR